MEIPFSKKGIHVSEEQDENSEKQVIDWLKNKEDWVIPLVRNILWIK